MSSAVSYPALSYPTPPHPRSTAAASTHHGFELYLAAGGAQALGQKFDELAAQLAIDGVAELPRGFDLIRRSGEAQSGVALLAPGLDSDQSQQNHRNGGNDG